MLKMYVGAALATLALAAIGLAQSTPVEDLATTDTFDRLDLKAKSVVIEWSNGLEGSADRTQEGLSLQIEDRGGLRAHAHWSGKDGQFRAFIGGNSVKASVPETHPTSAYWAIGQLLKLDQDLRHIAVGPESEIVARWTAGGIATPGAPLRSARPATHVTRLEMDFVGGIRTVAVRHNPVHGDSSVRLVPPPIAKDRGTYSASFTATMYDPDGREAGLMRWFAEPRVLV